MLAGTGILRDGAAVVAGGGDDEHVIAPGKIDGVLQGAGGPVASEAQVNDPRALLHGVLDPLRDGRMEGGAGSVHDLYRQHGAAVSNAGDPKTIVAIRHDGARHRGAMPKIIHWIGVIIY